ncbi:unnamed protein product [Parnassius mnemosyne]|uniref:Uncharacterized protein n=1 Tax=Parnassius mnemosyne TaxID=213953 RepID=A0AAV1K7S0_9NEOP
MPIEPFLLSYYDTERDSIYQRSRNPLLRHKDSDEVPAFLRYYRHYKHENPEKFLCPEAEEPVQVKNPIFRVSDILSSIIPKKKLP